MSPVAWGRSRLWAGFPRVSGDEPRTDHPLTLEEMFSPRERE